MFRRHLTTAVERARHDTPVVLVNGARQTGKTTLVRSLAAGDPTAAYFTFDDARVLAAARQEPQAFVDQLPRRVVLDEVQLVPEIFRALKLAVDRDRLPGRFLLTGSANVLMLPKLSDSLAGRMEIITLHPLSAGEIDGVREDFVDAVFQARFRPAAGTDNTRAMLIHRLLRGGYPEVQPRAAERRSEWFGAYLTTVLQRDVREIADIEGLTQMPQILTLLAGQSGALINTSSLASETKLSVPTLRRYLTLLRATYLYQPIPAWSGNVRQSLIKTPKAFLNDTGLLAWLLGCDEGFLEQRPEFFGKLLESFVAQELRKQIGWSKGKPDLYYFRTTSGKEVNFVLQTRAGSIVGIEVKAGAALRPEDFAGLQVLRDAVGARFVRGVLLYAGTEPLPWGDRLQAAPLPSLWAEQEKGAEVR